MAHLRHYVRRRYQLNSRKESRLDAIATDRQIEITAYAPLVGWKARKPVFVAFSRAQAKATFDGFENGSVVICIAPPHAAVATEYEQAVAFFCDENHQITFNVEEVS
jgi:hypothetical protein